MIIKTTCCVLILLYFLLLVFCNVFVQYTVSPVFTFLTTLSCLFLLPQVIELYRLLAVGISLWNQFAVPVLFSVFWFVLFIVQLCSDAMSGNASASHQGIMFFLLTRCDVIMWTKLFLCVHLYLTL